MNIIKEKKRLTTTVYLFNGAENFYVGHIEVEKNGEGRSTIPPKTALSSTQVTFEWMETFDPVSEDESGFPKASKGEE